MSDARDAILQAINTADTRDVPRRRAFRPDAPMGDLAAAFAAQAQASGAHVHSPASYEDVPATIAAILSAAGDTRLHLPGGSPLRALAWDRATTIILDGALPAAEDNALSAADYAIAETGTLVFVAGPQPSSWHFLPGRELVLVRHCCILPCLEDVLTLIATERSMPSTLNLVTGPSRTADIEQTIERGAHGPRELHILLVA